MDEFRAHFFKQLAHRFIATRRSDADAFIAQKLLRKNSTAFRFIAQKFNRVST
ncbi:hypothetical protein LTSEINV_1460 [Salmonella enterica subsp. enterica serovar Inverness str. R8-3668]|uniref:Uncharacterized protein n=1 Tax=Salmonella enterica subsp. enterica serovar Inverness str. R8-3668 TaxID=913075 RepID=G5NAH3_SALET|nr:hypothetical protein LTSEINV_1460 [Salmonella enterica subsp. enterica serovar Inverness str. R8-3668]